MGGRFKNIIKVVAFFVIIFIVNVKKVEAADLYKTGISFDDSGNLKVITHDKRATTNTTYETIGFTLKRYNMPIYHKEQQVAYILNSNDFYSINDPFNPGYAYFFYTINSTTVSNAINRTSREWYEQLYTYGGYIYIDDIITVYEKGIAQGILYSNGTYSGEVYFTVEGIINARNWKSKASLYTHFNRKIKYPVIKPPLSENIIITSKVKESFVSDIKMEASISAGIDNKEFFVESGIPSKKDIDIFVKASKFNYELNTNKITGLYKVPVKINHRYKLVWNDYYLGRQEETVIVGRTYLIERSFSYYELDSVKVYKLESILGGLSITSKFRQKEMIDVNIPLRVTRYGATKNHIAFTLKNQNLTIDGGTISGTGYKRPNIPNHNLFTTANNNLSLLSVKNDLCSVDNNIIMSDSLKTTNSSVNIFNNLPQIEHTIKDSIKRDIINNRYTGYVEATYKNIYVNEYKNHKEEIKTSVNVHTPVICNGYINEDKSYNQLISPDNSINQITIGYNLYAKSDAFGRHLYYPGYALRDYKEYVMFSEVKFPFDIIKNNKLVKANIWIPASVYFDGFFIPNGTKEGRYKISFRNIAYNYGVKDPYTSLESISQSFANINNKNYIASSEYEVELIGSIYGLSVNNSKGEFKVKDFPLNIETYEKQSISLKTKGDLCNDDDKVIIKGEFYAIDNITKNREKVDVYYKNGSELIRLENEITFTKDNRIITEDGIIKWSKNIDIPNNIYVKKPKDTKFLKEKIVVFNVDIITESNKVKPLSYRNESNYLKGYCNMWIIEKGVLGNDSEISIEFERGDIFVWDKIMSNNEYKVVGTH